MIARASVQNDKAWNQKKLVNLIVCTVNFI